MESLRKIFNDAPIDQIQPRHIAQYRDARGKIAAARHEMGLLSHIFDCAREWGYTDRENPCRGVKKPILKPRDFYADKAVWEAVYSHATPELRDAMDLAYLTGQRPGDVLKMQHADIQDGALVLQQQKTGKKLRILLAGTELAKVISRIRQKKISSFYLVATPRGERLNMPMLRKRWNRAKEKAMLDCPEIAEKIKKFQFRDIRAKAASDIHDLKDATALLGHSEQKLTETVYRRLGKTAHPTR
ncbi:MAG: tyrosine-type recombinase/integrase [Oxalobacter formigenes]|nr:tyrosine-type recombinase/integrase [Oxalobacter formigenes]